MSTHHNDVQHRQTFHASSDAVSVREIDTADGDGLFAIRMPVSSTAEARDGEAFSRERLDGFARQISEGDVGVFLDHGRSGIADSRYSALGKVGYWANADVVDRDVGADLVADAVLMDPADLDGAVGDLREALATLKAQAEVGVPLASSVGWVEDTGDRDVPGNADLLEVSIVGIPSDPRTTTASAEPATLARAVSAASSDFDVATFVRELQGSRAVGDDDWSAEMRLFRIVPAEGDGEQSDDRVLGVGVSFPESGVYVDWHTAAFPDELENPHVSKYGSVADLRKATGNQIVDMMPPSGARSAGDRNTVEVGGEEIDLTPPEAVQNAATVALAKDDELEPDCGTGAGRESARQIAADDVSPGRIDDIAAYLTSHEEDVTAEGPPTDWSDEEWQDCGNLQYALWGGTGTGTGLEWAQETANAVAEANGEELPYPERAARNLDDPQFSEGDAVMWTWQDEPVHGRVADVGAEFTVDGNTITGDEGEAVYLIHEWDEAVAAFRPENVAKPESSLDESTMDLPAATEDTMTDKNSDPGDDSGTDDGQTRGMEEMMAEMVDMQEEQTSMLREMYESQMGGDDNESDDDDAADADDARMVSLNGEELSAREAVAQLRESLDNAEPGSPQTEDYVTDPDDDSTDNTDFGFTHS